MTWHHCAQADNAYLRQKLEDTSSALQQARQDIHAATDQARAEALRADRLQRQLSYSSNDLAAANQQVEALAAQLAAAQAREAAAASAAAVRQRELLAELRQAKYLGQSSSEGDLGYPAANDSAAEDGAEGKASDSDEAGSDDDAGSFDGIMLTRIAQIDDVLRDLQLEDGGGSGSVAVPKAAAAAAPVGPAGRRDAAALVRDAQALYSQLGATLSLLADLTAGDAVGGAASSGSAATARQGSVPAQQQPQQPVAPFRTEAVRPSAPPAALPPGPTIDALGPRVAAALQDLRDECQRRGYGRPMLHHVTDPAVIAHNAERGLAATWKLTVDTAGGKPTLVKVSERSHESAALKCISRARAEFRVSDALKGSAAMQPDLKQRIAEAREALDAYCAARGYGRVSVKFFQRGADAATRNGKPVPMFSYCAKVNVDGTQLARTASSEIKHNAQLNAITMLLAELKMMTAK